MKPILVAGLLVAATIAVGLAADDTQRVVVKKPFDVNVAKGPSKGGTPQILWHGGSVLNQVTQAQLCSKLYPMIEFIKSWSGILVPLSSSFLYRASAGTTFG